jgi:hypothetical protein
MVESIAFALTFDPDRFVSVDAHCLPNAFRFLMDLDGMAFARNPYVAFGHVLASAPVCTENLNPDVMVMEAA